LARNSKKALEKSGNISCREGSKNYSQRIGIAAGGIFYNVKPELQLGFVLKVEIKN